MAQPSLFGDDAPAHEPAQTTTRGRTKPTVPPLPEPFAEPVQCGGFPQWWRRQAADDLAAVVAAGITEDELMRYLRGSLYLMTRAELVELANWLATTLRGNDGS